MVGYVKITLDKYDILKSKEKELEYKNIYIGSSAISHQFVYVKTCNESEAILALKQYINSQEERISTVTRKNLELIDKLKNRSWFHRLFNL